MPNPCRISLATDLDFGTAENLATAINQTSQITVRCPFGTTWRLALDNGVNATGSTRRMRSAEGNYIPCELYRNSARTQRCGSSTSETVTEFSWGEFSPSTNTVYGRVPVQAGVSSGTCLDTVTITLTC